MLGVVTLLVNEDDTRAKRHDLKRFLIASGGLVGIYMAGMIALSLLSGWVG